MMSGDSFDSTFSGAWVPTPQLAEITGQILAGLRDALQVGSGQGTLIDDTGNFKGAEQVVVWGKNAVCRTALCDGYIDVSAPLDSSEPESSAQYTRIHFRASLTMRVEQGDGSNNDGPGNGGNQAPDSRFHTSSPGVEKIGVGAADSTHGGDALAEKEAA